MFITDTYNTETSDSYQYGLDIIDYFLRIKDFKNFNKSYYQYIQLHIDDRIPLVYLEVYQYEGIVKSPWMADFDYTVELRDSEIDTASLTKEFDSAATDMLAVFDTRADTQLQAILNMVRTIFICVVLAVASIMFSKDTNIIVLGPIENMIQKVQKIS